MLKTRSIQYLQSRPHHIRVMIFIFTMFTAGILAFSFLSASLRNTFIAADIKKANEENGIVKAADADDVDKPSLLASIKANIGDLGSYVGSAFGGIFDDREDVLIEKKMIQEKNSPVGADVQKIKPRILPIEQQ